MTVVMGPVPSKGTKGEDRRSKEIKKENVYQDTKVKDKPKT